MPRTWLAAILVGCFYQSLSVSAQDELTPAQWKAVEAAESVRTAAIDRVYGSVVAVYGEDRAGGGSGVVFHPSGLVLTNHHVIAGAGESGYGGLADGQLYRWRLIGTDPGGDIAIIQLQGKDRFDFAPLGDSDTIRVGDWCMAMGNPFLLAEDQRPTVTLGVVSGIHRYQGGSKNLLVYGDCIQTDSSINPGNSGGPLFNLQGEVVGINGRGSFEERGRVNVGLGYAVSINQVKKFIPELLATKVALHGTLDAIFAMRNGKVTCEVLNLDGDAAQKSGLELGAHLLSFEGTPIKSANQFTNLLSTFPAGWPAEFVFEVDGQEKRGVLRLGSLPISLAPPKPRTPPPGAPKPGTPVPGLPIPTEPKPDSEKPGSPPPGEPAPKEPMPDRPAPTEPAPTEPAPTPPPMPTPPPRKPQPYELVEPGEAMSAKINAEFAHNAIESWRAAAAPSTLPNAPWRMEYQLLDAAEKSSGKLSIELQPTGEFTQILEMGSKPREQIRFVGERFLSQTGDAAETPLEPHQVWQNPRALPTWLASNALRNSLDKGFTSIVHEGADKANRRIASRLLLKDAKDRKAYLWFDAANWLLGDATPGAISKFSLDAEGEDDIPAVLFTHWTAIDGLQMPAEVIAVEGLLEKPVWRMKLVAPVR